MSEILFPPRSTKPGAEGSSNPGAADPAFAALLQDAEEIRAEVTADTGFLVAILQGVLPRPVAPASAAGEVEAGAVTDSAAAPLAVGGPSDDAGTREEAPATGIATENAGQILAMIFGAAAPDLPADLPAEPAPLPKAAPLALAADGGPDFAPLDRIASPPPTPPQASPTAPAQDLAPQAAPTAPVPLPPTAVPKRHDAKEPADDRSDLRSTETNRPADPPMPKADPRPASPEPAMQAKVEPLPGSVELQEKPLADTVLQTKSDAAAIQEMTLTRATTPRHDEGATRFLWRQAMQTEAVQAEAEQAETVQPDQADPPATVQRKTSATAPPPPAPQHRDEIHAAAIEPAAAADRANGPPAAPPAPPASTPAAAPASTPKADGTPTLPEAEVTKPDAPALPGLAQGLTQAVDTAPRSQIHDRAVAHPVSVPPLRQVVEALAAQPVDQPGRIELTLTPETLGKVHFDMRPEGGNLSIVLSAERPDTLDLMRRHLPELVAELKQAGIQAGSFSFSSWNEGQRAQSPRPETNTLEPTATAIALPPTPPPRPARAASALGGLDMRF